MKEETGMRTRTLVLVSTALVGVVVAGSVAFAQAMKSKGSGRGMYAATETGSTKLANGTTVRFSHDTGFCTGNEPGNPFDGTCQDCFASEVVAADGSLIQRKGHCIGIDRDGDTWTLWFDGAANPGTWTIIGGTGKFKGMEGGGTHQLVQKWPDGRYTISWEGSWQVK